MTIRRRLTLYYSGTILLIVMVTLATVGYALFRTVVTSVRETSRATALQIARDLERGTEPDAALLSTVRDGNVLVVIRDATGSTLVETDHPVAGIGADERAAADDVWRNALATDQAVSAEPVEAYVYALPVARGAGAPLVVESWVSYDVRGESSLPIDKHIVWIAGALLLASLLGGFLLVRGALRPVESLATAAEGITASDLSRRLPDRGTRDELDRVAASFNGVLSRLETSFAEREEVLAGQRRFISDASHELRTPLASLLGYARMLRAWGLADPKVAVESVAMIEREATRLVRMTELLLVLARGDEGGAPTYRNPHDLGELAAGEVDTVRAAFEGGPRFAMTTPKDPVMAVIEPSEVRRALGAILENAARFSPPDGCVRVTVGTEEHWATIAVTDTGPGIPTDHHPRLFDRFYQVDPSRATAGSGLGLAIAKQVVEGHGGRVEVASEPGQGATFTLHIPLAGPS